MALFDFVIRFIGDTKQFNTATKSVVGGLNRIGHEAKSGGMAIFSRHFGAFLGGAAFVAFGHRTLAMADQLDELSKRSKISTDFLQELDYATRHEGGSIQDFVVANRMLTIALAQTERGGKAQKAAIEALGLSFEKLSVASPEERFKMISDRLQDATLSTKQFDAARVLLGRGFDRTLPAMQAGLRTLGKAARDSGQVIRTDLIKQLADAKDAIEDVEKAATVGLAPAFAALAKYVDKIVVGWRMLAVMMKEEPKFKSRIEQYPWYLRGTGSVVLKEGASTAEYRKELAEFRKKQDEEILRLQEEFDARWAPKPAGAKGASSGSVPSPSAVPSLGQSATANMAAYDSSRIGLFVGSAFNPFFETALRQEQKLTAINQKLASIERHTERTADNVE